MSRLAIGLLGCGVAALHHIHVLKLVKNVDILWFCDTNEERAQNAKKLWQKDGAIGDSFEHLMNRAKPDVVHICTPPATHADFAVRALEAGCHVLLEKPMTTSVDEGKQILDTRDKTGNKLCIMHNHLFDPHIRAVRRMVSRGTLGELIHGDVCHFVDIHKMAHENLDDPNHWVHALKSGMATEFTPHSIYLLQSFLGHSQETEIMCGPVGSNKVKDRFCKSYAIHLRFEKALGRILLIDRTQYGHFTMDLYGTRAATHINMMDLTSSIEKLRTSLPLPAARMESTVSQAVSRLYQTLLNSVKIASGRLKRRPGHLGLIQEFYSSLRNCTPVPVSGEDGLAVVRTLECLDRALEVFPS